LVFQRVFAGRWSAISTTDGRVGGKTFECYQPKPETLKLMTGEGATELEIAVTLEARGAEPQTRNFPVNAALIEIFKTLAEQVQTVTN
jgi:hypothetical protein